MFQKVAVINFPFQKLRLALKLSEAPSSTNAIERIQSNRFYGVEDVEGERIRQFVEGERI